ncbi:MAG: lysophospholipid acyltransferase family protein [Parvularculaceae bacterium]
MIRSILFQGAYWTTSVFFAVTAAPLVLLPSRRPMSFWIGLYARVMRYWMRAIAGVAVTVRGREHLPAGPAIIAAKHQSWGDGFIMLTEAPDLAVVVGDHLERYPLVSGILRKMGAIVVDNCGGAFARASLVDDELTRAAADERRILIFPEGHLSPVGERHRYRRGVFHMYKSYGRPAVPVATNLGLFWPQQSWRLTPGEAIVEFLPAIDPGLGKDEFMTLLERTIETRSLELLGDRRPSGAVAEREPLPDPRPKALKA